MTFGERVREIRVAHGKSQREVADEVGIDFTYLSKVENGRMPPPAESTIVKLALALDTDSDELVQLAGKVPADLGTVIARTPAMPAFLRSISDLSPDEMRRIADFAKELKRERGESES